MRRIRTLTGVCAASALLMLAVAPTSALAGGPHDNHKSSIKVLLKGLSSPKGLASVHGSLIIGQGAFTPPPGAPVLQYHLRGPKKGTTTPLTKPVNLTDVAVSPKDGTGWGISGPKLLHQLKDGTIKTVLDIAAYQKTDPDPIDHDQPPNPTESNPYGLTVDRWGNALVADAAGDDVIRVTPAGHAVTVARFDLQSIKTNHLPADFKFPGGPIPPKFDAEPVPTTVTIGPDGAIYVGELKGFPFRPGTSNIWKIKPHAKNAWCSVNKPDPTRSCSLYSKGYTAIQDITFDRHGRLYVYELAKAGVLAFEPALDPSSGKPFPAAVLLKVTKSKHHEWRTELAKGKLSQPGGVVVNGGTVYVTDGVFTSGRLSKIIGG